MDEPKAEQNKILTQSLTPEKLRGERLGWIIDQLTIAAVAKGQPILAERLRINAEDLIDIPQPRLAEAFTRARRELDYVPGVAELRCLALADPVAIGEAKAEAGWVEVIQYMAKWGMELLPVYSAGRWVSAPPLPERHAYALRAIGGLGSLGQMTIESRPFMKRDFMEAFDRFDVAVENNLLPTPALTGKIHLLATKQTFESTREVSVVKSSQQRDPLTEAEMLDRREMLKQQAESLRGRR